MPRLNTGVQGSPIVATVAAKDRLTDGTQGSPVFIGTAVAATRKTAGVQGSPILRNEEGAAEPEPEPEAPTEIAGAKYWLDGLPHDGSITNGGQKYWLDGLPYEAA